MHARQRGNPADPKTCDGAVPERRRYAPHLMPILGNSALAPHPPWRSRQRGTGRRSGWCCPRASRDRQADPSVNHAEREAREHHPTCLIAPETRHAHCGAEFPGLGLLLAGDRQRTLAMRLGFLIVWQGRLERNFPAIGWTPSAVESAEVGMHFGRHSRPRRYGDHAEV
jgi:hypothetical protein